MKLIIFDLDGTLIDSQAIILGAQYETFALCGLTHPGRDAGLGVVGLTLEIALMQLAGLSQPDDHLTQTYREVFNEMRLRAQTDPALAEPLFPGVGDVLAALRARTDVVLGIATGKSRKGIDHAIAQHGWEGIFATTQSADDAPSKPHPGMILRAMSETGTAPDETMMVGDSSFDIEMAVAAGVLPVAVSWGFQPVENLMALGARHLLSTIGDLADLPFLAVEDAG